MKRSLTIFLMLCTGASLWGQPRITSTERLPVGAERPWAQPRFSPDGQSILFTSSDYSGIWQYTVADRTVRLLTADAGAGTAYALSPDGSRLTYRRNVTSPDLRERSQEIVLQDLARNTRTVVAAARRLSEPGFVQGKVVFTEGQQVRNLTLGKTTSEVTVLGIEDTKIVLNRNGARVVLDPLGNGHYIWPVLSPARDRLVAYDMDRGTFVCDLDGNVSARLGRRDAPVWTRDGAWLVFMDDRDDGQQILSSDLYAIAPDGSRIVQLTATAGVLEMYPDCSPSENRIVCSSADGALYLLTYTMEGK